MTTATAAAISAADAGSVDMALAGAAFPVGGIAVNSSDAGSVWCAARTVSTVRSTATRGGGCTVTTVRAGSVAVDGPVRNVDTSRAGSVKIRFTGPQASAGGGNDGLNRMVATTAATALDLLDVVQCTAHGDKLRALLAFVAGTAKMHARGGRIILFASLAMLLLLLGAAWI